MIPELEKGGESWILNIYEEDSEEGPYKPVLKRFSSTNLGDFTPGEKIRRHTVMGGSSPDFTRQTRKVLSQGPTFICRICEDSVPVVNEEHHTQYCEQRRDILDNKRKEVGDALFRVYTQLRTLIREKRDQMMAIRSQSFNMNS